MIKQHELALVNENIFRTVVSMNQGQSRRQCVGDELAEEFGCRRLSRRGKLIVRFQSQRFKETPIVKKR